MKFLLSFWHFCLGAGPEPGSCWGMSSFARWPWCGPLDWTSTQPVSGHWSGPAQSGVPVDRCWDMPQHDPGSGPAPREGVDHVKRPRQYMSRAMPLLKQGWARTCQDPSLERSPEPSHSAERRPQTYLFHEGPEAFDKESLMCLQPE